MNYKTTHLTKTENLLALKWKIMQVKPLKKISLLIGILFMISTNSIQAQEYQSLLKTDSIFNDTIDYLIISEWRGDSWSNAYIELTNMGQKSIDLRKMAVRSLPGGKKSWDFVEINSDQVIVFDSLQLSEDEYTLDPGEVFLMAPAYDELTNDGGPIHRPELVAMADYVGYKIESGVPNDTSNYGERFFRQWSSYPIGVFVALRQKDTIPPFYKQEWFLVDNINGDRDPITLEIGQGVVPVAGFPEATGEAVLIRKHTVTKGTRQDGFADAASDDITTSEWIPIKHDDNNPGGKVFKTAGNHGNFTMDAKGGNGAVVDLDNGILEVPWGALRGEDIIDNEVILGQGMAWTYQNYSEDADSLLDINELSFNKIAMPGDVLTLYACGNDVDTAILTIKYLDFANDMVKVYPTYKKNADGEWMENYYVTDEETVIDTIGNIPFATRADTLLNYLRIPPNASYSFVFLNDEQRADVRDGDKLKITGADGTTIIEYYLSVLEYTGSSENRLATITWPDIYMSSPTAISYYLQNGWTSGNQISDTLPDFSPTNLSYYIKLAPGTEQVPALSVAPYDQNAYIKIDRAVNTNGTLEERTTTITVTSEDSTSVQQYTILFDVMIDDFQKYIADPFFSDVIFTFNTKNSAVEIVNPGNVPLDLSKYLVLRTDKSTDYIAAIMDTAVAWDNRYSRYIPGYVYKAKDTAVWNTGKDFTWMRGGSNIKSTISAGDVFVMANMHNKPAKWWPSIANTQEIDVLFHPEAALVEPYYPEKSLYTQEELDAAGEPVNGSGHVGYARAQHSFFLFKILNDSILAGTKTIVDPDDFELIDAVCDPVNNPLYVVGSWDENGDSSRVWTINKGGVEIIREPDIYKGVKVLGEGINADYTKCQWIAGDEDYWPQPEPNTRFSGMTQHVGTHNMDVPTVYMSTINSAIYIVSSGYSGQQTIKGVVDTTTVAGFVDNIIKSDTAQTLQVYAVADGSPLGVSDLLHNGDSLVVHSADQKNSTTYILDVTANGLKSDATLSSSVYAVTQTGETGTIADINYGTTIKDVMENVTKDEDAKLVIINENNEPVGLNIVTATGDIVLQSATSDIYFEVTAQDKVTKIVYQLVPTKANDDAFVLSDIYDISEWLIDGLNPGVSVDAFFDKITVVGGESYLEDKMGFKRTVGKISYDDKLVVISENQSVTVKYDLGFLGIKLNQAPIVDLVSTYDATENVTFTLTATATDDNLPQESTLSYDWAVTSGNSSDVIISSPGSVTTDITISDTGSYEITLTVSDGELETSAVVAVTVTSDVGMAPTQFEKLNVYPNPTTGTVFIEGLKATSRVRVMNMAGTLVDEFDMNDGRRLIHLDNVPNGTYIILVGDGNHSWRQARVVKRK